MAKTAKLPIFLKAIYIQGFKSFADKVKLDLGHGLSVVVGPNGSGKSNVADAVRWVLGEQSAKSLRGTKMEDVIFAGSTKRRPVGMAEVSLVFDNTLGIFPLDFLEVTITRRVYRSGEGQYFINKASCRLKDIQELFMDTGAGKEGFSIIGQGRVEEILTLKSEDRRILIEEAAGITKYRARKREAVKRLDDTGHNLQRIEDILQEIEGQLSPLAVQAQIAEQNIALTEEKSKLEIQAIVYNIKEIKDKLSSVEKDFEELNNTQAELAAELAKEEMLDQTNKQTLSQVEEDVQEQQAKAYQVEQQLNELVYELNLRKERHKHLLEQATRLKQELTKVKDKRNSAKAKLESLESKKLILETTIATSHLQIKDQENIINTLRAQNGLEDFEIHKAELFEEISVQTNISNELTGIRHTLKNYELQENQLLKQKCEKEQELKQIEADLLEHGELLTQIENKEAERLSQENTYRSKFLELQEVQKEKQTESIQLARKIDQLRAKWQALKSLDDSLEGYQRGVREVVLGHKKGIEACSGVCGTLADLIKVEEKFEIAIETAAGMNLQNIINDTEKAAKACINYLKANHLGRATFLPLDVIRANRVYISKELAATPGYIGLAADLVKFEGKYQAAVDFVLGRTIIAENIDAAALVAKASGYKIRIVTLDGDQINPGGALTGGSIQRKGGNLLARTRELEELNTELLQNEGYRVLKENELVAVRIEKEKCEEIQNTLRIERQTLRERNAAVKVNFDNNNLRKKRLEQEINLLDLNYHELLIQIHENEEQLVAVEQQAEAVNLKITDLRQEIANREQAAKETAEKIEKLAAELTQTKIQAAKWEEELCQLISQIKQDKENSSENDELFLQKTKELEDIQLTLLQNTSEQKELNTQIELQTKELEEQQLKLVRLRQNKENLTASLLKLEEQLKGKRQEIQFLEQRIHTMDLRKARWEAEWESGLNRLQEEFSLSWEEASQYFTDRDKESLLRRIQEIKKEIEDLGPINHAAIEEYPKMQSRHEFLLVQHKDLIEAEQKLRELISDLDKTMGERFAKGFNAVNEAFQEVFKELFNGGQAELRLDDPDNLLDTGVEIIAQPPGKKPQLLSLLSGGERALTAITLLFALLRVKPSPFCILDEIEASLDDSNVQRFAQYIHRLSHSTQFIVISHRKGTMEAADVLYGITMEELGVSKLFTVKMDETVEDPASA